MAEAIKRFIAGAVCPRCGEMDRLVTYTDENGTFKECVACQFEEKQQVQLEINELDTRVNNLSGSEFPEGKSVSEEKDMSEEQGVQVVQVINQYKP